MKKIISALAVIIPAFVLGQSSNQNYVKTTTYKQPTSSSITTPTPQQAAQTIGYFDGLGRPVQQIAGKMSGEGKDLITHIEYDSIGRQKKEFLPLASSQNNLAYISSGLPSGIASQYQIFYGESNPYSMKLFEPSPLNRVLKQSAPGNDWAMGQGHEVRLDYQTNDVKDVRLYRVTAEYSETTLCYEPSLIDNGDYYDANTVFKTITKNENWVSGTDNTTEEFKDKEGHVLLKRTYNGEAYDTYYVYDDYGNLTYVLPPAVDTNSAITQDILDNLCYQYKYDSRNRLVEKKLPGKQWEYIVYNSQDKPVATGPAYDPFGGSATVGFLVTKYDALGRVAYTGWFPVGPSLTTNERVNFQTQTQMNNQNWKESYLSSPITFDGKSLHYTNTVYPTSEYKLLTINYYDIYEFLGSSLPATVEGVAVFEKPIGLPTGSWVRVLENPSATIGELSYTLYDVKGRAIRTQTDNYLGGFTKNDSKLDFVGKPNYTVTTHKRLSSDNLLTVREEFKYNDQDRLVQHTHKVNNLPKQFLAVNHYDKLGQLVLKDVGNDSIAPYQKVDYKYNIRGWLTDINKVDSLTVGTDPQDLFAFKINYNKNIQNDNGGEIVPLYNGNIAETSWISSSDQILRRYGYSYDKLNRLMNARYQKPNNATPITNMYDESLTYDKNGNIQSLQRNGDYDSDIYGAIQIDDLVYTYDTDKKNQLVKVDDNSNSPKGFNDIGPGYNDYVYDDNGNLTSDATKGITDIGYNHLNLPVKIIFASGDRIAYLYDATGKKLRKIVTQNGVDTTTYYLDGFQYTGAKLNFFPHAEGYVNVAYCDECQTEYQTRYNYVYQYKDHLGNIRLSYGYDQADQVLKIIEENHYYPFGLKHSRYNTGAKKYEPDALNPELMKIQPLPAGETVMNKYKFQGQERQDELGLNWDSFKWRNYDSATGRFMNIDPLAEKFAYQSPYNFSENRVIDARELEGLEAVLVHGTWANREDKKLYSLDKADYKGGSTWQQMFSQRIALATGWNAKSTFEYTWSGENNSKARKTGGEMLAKMLMSKDNPYANGKHATLIGHSHGGNVNKVAKNILEKNGWTVDIINISTPQRKDFQQDSTGNGINLNFYSYGDAVQWFGVADNYFMNDRDNGGEEGARIDPYSWSYEIDVSDDIFNWLINGAGHSYHQNYRAQQQILKHIEEAVERSKEKEKHPYNGK